MHYCALGATGAPISPRQWSWFANGQSSLFKILMRLVNDSFTRLGAVIFSFGRCNIFVEPDYSWTNRQYALTRYSREPIAAGRRVDEFGESWSIDDEPSNSPLFHITSGTE